MVILFSNTTFATMATSVVLLMLFRRYNVVAFAFRAFRSVRGPRLIFPVVVRVAVSTGVTELEPSMPPARPIWPAP